MSFLGTSRTVALLSLTALAGGCYSLYSPSKTPQAFSRPAMTVQLESEMPPHFDSHVRCALARLDAVRALPSFDETVLGDDYGFTGQPEALSTSQKVLECARRPLNLGWSARHCPWVSVWPFKREVGSTHESEGVWRMKTYDCEITTMDTAALAGHFLHEHMHTCGYVDPAGNADGKVVTYRINEIVEALAKQTPVCPGL
ncbi:hypothetical protein LXT21_35790 [Myxococcus sp. K38C18041901]|uniref:hypothetical protein n=1 Tax=Myxococcus guangdongensis TaxID=2906760 RepID=UPI0020A7B2DF|nr:hypothetical protein [Myxococcus guangdongensis]MCP3064149.1 hypothetical protein [Myxococcus guangdongensis]